jgi:mono/diheme cytochrome c family protein
MNTSDPEPINSNITSGENLSYWIASSEPIIFAKVVKSLETDVLVIGGGIAGLTTAYCLTQAGRKVILVEDGFIGSGESGRTTAHVTCALDDRYFELEKIFGKDKAGLAANSHMAAIEWINKTVLLEKIECNFKRVDGYLFLHPSDTKETLDKEYEATKQVGLLTHGVTGYPFVQAKLVGDAGNPDHAVGRRVDDQKLKDMTAYLFSLPAPAGAKVNTEMAARGRELFRTNCTGCHNADQSKPVDAKLLNLKSIWPAYNPGPAGVRGDRKQSPIINSPGDFDDKMVVVDASDHGEPRGNALPMLLDLARTNIFLHNASVKSLDELLNPKRGKKSPHPFYIDEKAQREDIIEFLRGLDTEPIETRSNVTKR